MVTSGGWWCLQIGGGRVMDEVEVDAELQARRHAQPGYIEPSFPTIAGLRHLVLPIIAILANFWGLFSSLAPVKMNAGQFSKVPNSGCQCHKMCDADHI